jgi:hypothetical protein
MKRLAIRSALSGKLADGQLHVVDELSFARPRTKEMVRVLENVGIQRSALVVTGEPDGSVRVSARNLQKTKVLPAGYLNVVDLLTHRDLLLTEDAVRRVEGLWGSPVPEAPATEEPKPRRRRVRAAQEPPAETEVAVEEKPARRRAATKASAGGPKPRRRKAATAASAKAEETPEKPTRRRAATKASAEEPKPRRRRAATAASPVVDETPEKPARRTRRPRAKADEKVAEAAEETKPARRRARPKKGEEA